MDNDEILARFGISKRLAYGLFFQSILVMCSTVISLLGLFGINTDFTLRYITNFISIFVCISLLVYSFYGFNAKRNQEAFFTSAVILYILFVLMGLLTTAIEFKTTINVFPTITLICMIFFLREYKINYKVANYAILIALISSIIVMVFDVMNGEIYLFVAIRNIVLPVTIGLTYFERVQRGKYDFKVWKLFLEIQEIEHYLDFLSVRKFKSLQHWFYKYTLTLPSAISISKLTFKNPFIYIPTEK